MEPQTLINRLLVTIPKKYNDLIGDIIIDTSIKPGWHATVTGKVVCVPEYLDNDPFRKNIYMEIRPGDEVAFSYHVVFDNTHSDNAEQVFSEEAMLDPFITSYSNPRGERLVVVYLKNDKFGCGHYDPDGREVERLQPCSMFEKENWLGKFIFTETNDMTYNNLIEIDGKEYWQVDYSQVYAVKRGDKIIMIGSYVMIDPINSMDIDDTFKTSLILHDAPRKKINVEGRGRILEIGDPLINRDPIRAQKGDIVVFDKRYAEQYVFWGQDCVLLKQERLRAKVKEGAEAILV